MTTRKCRHCGCMMVLVSTDIEESHVDYTYECKECGLLFIVTRFAEELEIEE